MTTIHLVYKDRRSHTYCAQAPSSRSIIAAPEHLADLAVLATFDEVCHLCIEAVHQSLIPQPLCSYCTYGLQMKRGHTEPHL